MPRSRKRLLHTASGAKPVADEVSTMFTSSFRFLLPMLPCIVLAVACSEDGNGTPDNGVKDSGTQSNGDSAGPPPGADLKFSRITLDRERSGIHTDIASHGDTIGIAYFREVAEADAPRILCPASGLNPPYEKKQLTQDVYYVAFNGTDWGSPVRVDQTYGPRQGLSTVIDGNGNPHIGYLGGGPDNDGLSEVECYSSDAFIADSSNGGISWSPRSVFGGGGGLGGDSGGYWMALAMDCDGQVQSVHRDVHYGYYEEENGWRKADWRFGGGETIRENKGDGLFNELVYDNCQPVALSYNDTQTGQNGGLLLATQNGGTWSIEQVAATKTDETLGLATDGQGLVGVAFFDASEKKLRYTESTDLQSWSAPTLVDSSTDWHGQFASLAYDSNGNPAVSYYRCAKDQGAKVCDDGDDALMLAYRIDGKWENWEVDTGNQWACGTHTALTFSTNDEPVIAYQCVILDNVSGDFINTLKVARGSWKQ